MMPESKLPIPWLEDAMELQAAFTRELEEIKRLQRGLETLEAAFLAFQEKLAKDLEERPTEGMESCRN